MRSIGISPLDKDATVSLVEDGQLLYAAGEERFTRNKQQSGFPALALQDALSKTGTRPEEVDFVSYPFLEWQREQKLYSGNLADEIQFLNSHHQEGLADLLMEARQRVPDRVEPIHGLANPNERIEKGRLYDLFYKFAGCSSSFSRPIARHGSRDWSRAATSEFRLRQQELLKGLTDHGLAHKPLKRIDHHLSHAANSYFASGYDRALCITLDGYGSGLAGSVSEADKGHIKRLHGISYPNSLGTMYEHVTSSLGFRPSRHEGKIVGLAAYGDPNILTKVLLSRIVQAPGDFRIFQANNVYFSRYLAAVFPKIDVAAAYQHVLEIVATEFVRHWVETTGINRVVLSGGVTANVKLNQRIFELEGVDEIFIYPNMGDGGCGSGAAMFHTWPGGVRDSMKDAYLGPCFDESELHAALNESGVPFTRPERMAADVARLIHDGQVVARFDGRMEYGPRALGNRSIMYHAREPDVNQWLNKRLGRTEFMPFAPVTLWESREKCYHNIKGAEHAAEFMTITFDCTDEMKRTCPAAVHVDGTARPQLIKRDTNPGYYDIVKEYEALSGIPSLINTSFNMHEEPIVCSPKDAIRAFLQGKIDYLVLGPFLARHPDD